MTVDMIGEAEDRRMKEAAIKDALRRRIEGGHDPKTEILAKEVPKCRRNQAQGPHGPLAARGRSRLKPR
jgi:hypothetical protein